MDLSSTDVSATAQSVPQIDQSAGMDPLDALARRLGASWRSELLRAGVTDGALTWAVRRGRVNSLGAGVYALPDASPDAVTAAALRGRLTCASGAARAGVELLTTPVLPHVLVPRNRPATSDIAVVHRADLPGRGPVVHVLGCLVAVLKCLPPVEAVVAVDCALRQRTVTAAALRARLRGPGSVEARRVLDLADGRSGSPIETVLRLALRQAGLMPALQVVVAGVGRVDFLLDGWLVVEVDGFAFHSDRADYRRDRTRTNALTAQGYTVLRFSYEDVMFRTADCVRTVLAVRARGH